MEKYDNKVLKTVLITCLSGMGDVAMTIPIVYPVCEANPQMSFVFVTQQEYASMFVNRPANLIVLGIDFDKYKGITGPMKLARNLHHRYNFDALADLNGVLRTWLMSIALRQKDVTISTIDKGGKEKKALVGGKTRTQLKTTHERYRAVFKKLGLKSGKEFVSIEDYGEPLVSPIVPVKDADEKWIAIAPFSTYRGKEYPLEQMRLVVAEMSRWENCHLFLMGGGKKERDALAPIMRRYSNVLSLPHIKHSLVDELALMRHCDVMISMDSASMHLASLVALPVVSVWGATHPHCGFLGWHQAMRDTVQLELDCRPCSVLGNKKCRYGDYHCMRDINPELILDKVKTVLER